MTVTRLSGLEGSRGLPEHAIVKPRRAFKASFVTPVVLRPRAYRRPSTRPCTRSAVVGARTVSNRRPLVCKCPAKHPRGLVELPRGLCVQVMSPRCVAASTASRLVVARLGTVGAHRGRKSGGADADRRTGGFAGRDLPGEHRGEVLLVAPPAVAGLFGQPGGGLADAWRLERLSEVANGLDRIFGHAQATSPSEVTVLLMKSTPNARS